jgi:hypothetical protein
MELVLEAAAIVLASGFVKDFRVNSLLFVPFVAN